MTTGTEGQTISLYETFLDDNDDPIYPSASRGAPVVRLYDLDKSIIAQVVAIVDPSEAGQWRADVPVPDMDLDDTVKLKARWVFYGDDGERYTAKEWIEIEPATTTTDEDIIIMLGRDMKMQLTLPFRFRPPVPEVVADKANHISAKPAKRGDKLSFSLYQNNKPVYENMLWDNSAISLESMSKKTLCLIPAVVGQPTMSPLTMVVSHQTPKQMAPTLYTFKVWGVTPTMLQACSHLDDFVNKAKLANVIPELQYRQSDYLEALFRGLHYFNGLQPLVTNFTGTNMQGPIFTAWITCSTLYVLGAQIQAEGAMAFDFGGQSVSLNIDRTPAIESALGRIDSEIESQVKPFKKLLVRAGVISGDGSQGGAFIDGSRALGTLGLTNAPTTRIPWAGRGGWFRGI